MILYHIIMNLKFEGFFAGELVWKICSILTEYRRHLNMLEYALNSERCTKHKSEEHYFVDCNK